LAGSAALVAGLKRGSILKLIQLVSGLN